MSFITSGVKMRLCPSTFCREEVLSEGIASSSLENELPLGRLEVVVVVELLAAHELLELGRGAEVVDAELAVDVLGVGVGPLAGDAVDAERLDLAGHVDGSVVHGVAQARAGVAADDLAAALHHEAGHRADAAHGQDQAALLVDARACPGAALDDQVAAAQGGTGQGAGIALDDNDAGHHVLAGRPADPAGDVHLGAVDHAAAEVAEAAVERDLAAGQDADAKRVLGARVLDRDVGDAALVEQVLQLQVDLAGGELGRVEHGGRAVHLRDVGDVRIRLHQPTGVIRDLALAYRFHTSTSPSYGSYVSISWSMIARIAISSEARATRSSDS